ncbi:hypothetical protein SteCoe_8006 [Stentor coeruleus]|uniref:Uncharacterized protein n=1 Tax=Stentor coeruleus TaxID=5963 RepID=A0A1R2CLB5_9CILI|nr:hypothetical protein SteCoe_8006 [Stentor coeruleus]
MSQRILRDKKKPTIKLGKIKSLASISKTPKYTVKLTERKVTKTSSEIPFNIPINEQPSPQPDLSQKLEEAKREILEYRRKNKEYEAENISLKTEVFKLSKFERSMTIESSLFSEKSPSESIDLSSKQLVERQSAKEKDLILENEQLQSKISLMDTVIRELKQNGKNLYQEFQNELLKYKKALENSEKSMKLKDLEVSETKKTLRTLESQKMTFVSSIKDLELEIIAMKQEKEAERSAELEQLQKKTQEIIALQEQLKKSQEETNEVREELQDYIKRYNTLSEKAETLQKQLDKEQYNNFIYKFKVDYKFDSGKFVQAPSRPFQRSLTIVENAKKTTIGSPDTETGRLQESKTVELPSIQKSKHVRFEGVSNAPPSPSNEF